MRSTRLVLVLALAAGCGGKPTGRDADCAKVRAVVERAVEGVPRRYRDEVLRERARAQLQQIEYTDDAIRRAALDERVTYDAIEHACAPAVTDREHDCAAVRAHLEAMRYALLPDRSRGGGIRDEGTLRELAQRTYLDAAVKHAVGDVVRDTGTAFYTPDDRDDRAAVDRAARAAYERLAAFCELPPLP